MHQIFSAAAYTTNTITCPQCNWEGLGNDTVQEHLFLTDAIELYCPTCNHYMGFVDTAEASSLH